MGSEMCIRDRNIAGAQVKASPDEVERMLKDIIDQEYQEENTK